MINRERAMSGSGAKPRSAVGPCGSKHSPGRCADAAVATGAVRNACCGQAFRAVFVALLPAVVAACMGCSAISESGIKPVSYRPPSPDWNDRPFLKTLVPSNDRDWAADQAVLPTAEFHGRQATVRNIRNIRYRTIDDFDVHYYDRTFDLDRITSVDFIVVPFNDMPGIGIFEASNSAISAVASGGRREGLKKGANTPVMVISLI